MAFLNSNARKVEGGKEEKESRQEVVEEEWRGSRCGCGGVSSVRSIGGGGGEMRISTGDESGEGGSRERMWMMEEDCGSGSSGGAGEKGGGERHGGGLAGGKR